MHNPKDRKRVRIHKGTIYVRHEDRTEGISRSELEKYFNSGLRKIFEDETEYALQLALNQPEFWEYLLTAELLKSKLALVKRDFSELKQGLLFKPSVKMSGSEFMDWISLSSNNLVNLISFLKAATEAIPVSWGKEGVAGDPLEVKRIVDKVVSGCNELLNWEIHLRSLVLPEAFLHLQQMMTGWTLEYVNQLEKISFQLFSILNQSDPEGTHVIKIVLDAPANLQQAMDEIQRLKMNSKLWIDS